VATSSLTLINLIGRAPRIKEDSADQRPGSECVQHDSQVGGNSRRKDDHGKSRGPCPAVEGGPDRLTDSLLVCAHLAGLPSCWGC
jgi:hypothetical protein